MINRFIIFLCLLPIFVACSEENTNTNVEIIAKNLSSKVGDRMITKQPTWNFYDPYKDLTNKDVLKHYNSVLKKKADSIRKNSVILDSSF